MSETARSLVGALAPRARVTSSCAHSDAVIGLANELLDPVAGLAQGARALLSFDGGESNELREELLELVYDRARELHDALVYYHRLARPTASGVS